MSISKNDKKILPFKCDVNPTSEISLDLIHAPINCDKTVWKSMIPVKGTVFVYNGGFSEGEPGKQLDMTITLKRFIGNDIFRALKKGEGLAITALDMKELSVKFLPLCTNPSPKGKMIFKLYIQEQ